METTDSGTVLTVAGLEELTAANADQFRNQVCAALDGHTVVDIVNVEAPENPSFGRSSASSPLSLPSFPVPQSAIAV